MPEEHERLDHHQPGPPSLAELARKVELIEEKFKSANSVPVDRITIKRSEWFPEEK